MRPVAVSISILWMLKNIYIMTGVAVVQHLIALLT